MCVFSLRMRRIRSVQKKWRKPNWRPDTLSWVINPADPICSEKDCRRGWDSFILSFYSRQWDENHFILLLDHWVIRRDTDHRSLGSRTSQHHVTESWATDGVRTVLQIGILVSLRKLNSVIYSTSQKIVLITFLMFLKDVFCSPRLRLMDWSKEETVILWNIIRI